jgi:hypothetical protein
MAKPEETAAGPTLEVRGTVDLEKYKAAKVLGGQEARFELRAMKPVQAGVESRTILCIICIICIVCIAEKAQQFNIPGLAPLPTTT